jgi:hypothetical protein
MMKRHRREPRPASSLRAAVRAVAVALGALASGGACRAQDRADLDRTQIIGNRELPKVLYIVPWKKPLPGDAAGRPPVSVLDEALAPVDRDVLRRQVSYDAPALPRPTAPAALAQAK